MATKIEFNRQALASVLKASHETEISNDPLYVADVFRFHDPLLRFVLRIHPNIGSAQIAMDPDEPIQPCPMLEYSFNCCEIEIGQSAYSLEYEAAVRFYEHRQSRGGLRLTLTPRHDGRWYIWANAWHDPDEFEEEGLDRGQSGCGEA